MNRTFTRPVAATVALLGGGLLCWLGTMAVDRWIR